METLEYLALSYIEKLDLMITQPSELHLPEEASFVAQYLEKFRPVDPPELLIDNMTSLDIQEDLQSVCNVDINIIARVMKMLGYRLYFESEHSPAWSAKHIDSL